jgi:hypothetical protein
LPQPPPHFRGRARSFAVFAVLPGNLQRARHRSPQKSWAADDSAREENSKTSAVTRLFFAVFVRKNSDNNESHYCHNKLQNSTARKSKWQHTAQVQACQSGNTCFSKYHRYSYPPEVRSGERGDYQTIGKLAETPAGFPAGSAATRLRRPACVGPARLVADRAALVEIFVSPDIDGFVERARLV